MQTAYDAAAGEGAATDDMTKYFCVRIADICPFLLTAAIAITSFTPMVADMRPLLLLAS